MSGRIEIRIGDATESEIRPDEALRVDPGHDAWTVEDVPYVQVDFEIAPTYPQPPE